MQDDDTGVAGAITEAPMGHTRVALIGNVDAGKSTLTGVISRDDLDDGRGKARTTIFCHEHEKKTGRTSCISTTLIGFTEDGLQIIPSSRQNERMKWAEISQQSRHTISLIDLCGHERYLKSTVFGLTATQPHLAILVVGANMGLQRMTKEHVGIVSALRIPFILVVTKIDLAPPDILKQTCKNIKQMLKSARKMSFVVNESDGLAKAIESVSSGHVVPVIMASNVTGVGIGILKNFLKGFGARRYQQASSARTSSSSSSSSSSSKQGLRPQANDMQMTINSHDSADNEDKESGGKENNNSNEKSLGQSVFGIEDVYVVPGTGIVVSGLLSEGSRAHNNDDNDGDGDGDNGGSGSVRPGDKLLLGPDRAGCYIQVIVRSIERQCTPTSQVQVGENATLAIRSVGKRSAPIRRNTFRKGMVLVKPFLCNSRGGGFGGGGGGGDASPPSSHYPYITPVATRYFDAEVMILHHQSTIKEHYEAVIHCGVVRQCARVCSIAKKKKKKGKGGYFYDGNNGDKNGKHALALRSKSFNGNHNSLVDTRSPPLRTGDRAMVRFQFSYFKEYLQPGKVFLFRDGSAKGIGIIRNVTN